MMPFQLEVCVESLEGALVASNAGATRIELSQQLDVGGITPSLELVHRVCSAVAIPVVVLIRIKPGGFVYSESKIEQMVHSIKPILRHGAEGIAIGALDDANDLHWDFMSQVAQSVSRTELVVHRAFDHVVSPVDAIHRLINLGFHRILTSGGPPHAWDGTMQLRAWQVVAEGRIEILPAGGIHSQNAKEILLRTGCNQLHGSFRGSSRRGNLPCASEIQQVRNVMEST